MIQYRYMEKTHCVFAGWGYDFTLFFMLAHLPCVEGVSEDVLPCKAFSAIKSYLTMR